MIDSVADTAKAFDIETLHIIGHADRLGPAAYNDKLSHERAKAVRDALGAEGMSVAKIGDVTVTGKGESEPMVETGDGEAEPANRRVMISFASVEPAMESSQPSN